MTTTFGTIYEYLKQKHGPPYKIWAQLGYILVSSTTNTIYLEIKHNKIEIMVDRTNRNKAATASQVRPAGYYNLAIDDPELLIKIGKIINSYRDPASSHSP